MSVSGETAGRAPGATTPERAAGEGSSGWSEDWVAVGLGFLALGLALAGVDLRPVSFKWAGPGDLAAVLGVPNLWRFLRLGLAFAVLAAAGVAATGEPVRAFLRGFPVLFVLAWIALVVAGNAGIAGWGLEYVIWALLLGLVVGNVIGVPAWLAPVVRTEFYIKTGLVILGSSILFREVLQAGVLGVVQAVLVVLLIWFACFHLSRLLRVDDEFAVMLSTAVSICGVSAAIAACGAIQGDRRKLSYVTSLVLIVAVPMMVLEPWLAKAWGLSDLVAGAWIGGTLDTSGSVVAAGALVSEAAMKAGVIVKFSQNVLIGVAAFLLAVWWTMRGSRAAGAAKCETGPPNQRPSAGVIWERFPKFVLGFLVASAVFSFVLAPPTVAASKDVLKGLQQIWFALAFVSIGLETRFGELVSMEGGRPAVAFVGAQVLNVAWTLLLAFLLFGGVLVPAPEIR
jgi:uncharacterized membrane protein YadS